MEFKSRIDKWYKAIHWGSLALVVIAVGVLWLDPESGIWSKVLFSLLMGTVGWLMMDIYAHTYYTVSDGILYIKSGPFRWRIKLSNIEWVRPSRNLLSSPALSLDRLAIKQLSSNIPMLISPQEKEAFLEAIADSDEGLVYQDDQVTRT